MNAASLLRSVVQELCGKQQRYQMIFDDGGDINTHPNPVIRFSGDDALQPWGDLTLWARVERGKVTVHGGYPRYPGLSHYSWPKLNSCSFSIGSSAPVKAIANRIAKEIIEPAKPLMAEYKAKSEAHRAMQNTLPGQIAKFRQLGVKVSDPASADATEAAFSHRFGEDWMSGRIYHDGRMSIDRMYASPNAAEAIIKALAAL